MIEFVFWKLEKKGNTREISTKYYEVQEENVY